MISYIILTCNQDYRYLQECVDSIKRLEGEKEIVIVNNGTDYVPDSITAGYNLNCVEGRRFGFNHSHGDYIHFIDADDLVLGTINDSEYSQDIIQCSVALKSSEEKEPYIRIAKPCENILSSYCNGLWSRVFKRSFLERVYKEIPVMENIFWQEDKILMKQALSLNPSIAFNPTVIYQYNIYRSASTNKNKYPFIENR